MKNGNGRARRIRLGHRNIGMVMSIFLLLLVVTGFLLNHANDFGLDANSVPAFIADRYYAESSVEGYRVRDHWLYEIGETLYMDQEAVGFCEAGLVGAAALADFVAAACGSELTLLTADAVVVERLGASHGVPTGIEAVAVDGERLVLKTSAGIVAFDPQSLSISDVNGEPAFAGPAEVPVSLLMTDSVTWEQFILDLHSGRYLGEWGIWLSDFIALLLAVLAISGVSLSLMPRPAKCNGK